MARPNIETAAAPAVQGGIEEHIQLLATLLIVGSVIAAALWPGALIGAGITTFWLWRKHPPTTQRLAVALVGLVSLVALRHLLQPGWLWRDTVKGLLSFQFPEVKLSLVLWSLPVEALIGPLWLETIFLATALRRRTVRGQIRRDHRRDRAQWRAIDGRMGTTSRLSKMLSAPASIEHPPGYIRLGIDGETNKPLDLKLPQELESHVFLPGVSNSGKTTTLSRIADGALANWYGIVIIDAKGSALGDTARELAGRYDLPFFLVDPEAPDTLGYDICAGSGADVSNKLIGAFSYGPNAEIYKNIAMASLPLVVDGLREAAEDITLERIYDAFGTRGYATIAHHIAENNGNERIRTRLLSLAAGEQDALSRNGRMGLQHRIGALLEGKFGNLFRLEHMLDWDYALAQPSVVYIALSALASSEDVELMGRVVAQDLKQVCGRRLQALRKTGALTPFLAIFDEFAALREAEQLTDLLLQARQALFPTIISTQYIPESVPLQKSVLGAGLMICHRVEGGDAEAVANQLGTHKATELTKQIDFTTGFSEKGTHKRVDVYNVSPNILRTLKTGFAVLKSVTRNGHAVVHVYRDPQ